MKTPLHDRHLALDARMVDFAGWQMPVQYRGILDEHHHTRTTASLFDTCHMGEFTLEGPTAEADLERLLTPAIHSLRIGRCRYGYLLNDRGGVLDDLTVYRRAPDRFLLVVNAGTRARDADWIRGHLSPGTTFHDRSDDLAKLDLQGPATPRLFSDALQRPLPPLRFFQFVEEDWDGLPVTLSRTGYTGEWGLEIYLPAPEAPALWDRLLAHPDILPAGLGARDTLRLEVGYPLYGHEFSEDRSPLDVSRGAFLDFDTPFIGRDPLRAELDGEAHPLLLALRLEGRRAARAGDRVFCGDTPVGTVTSGSLAPSLGVAIALARVDRPAAADPDAGLTLDVRGRRLPAERVDLPFYPNGSVRLPPPTEPG